MHSKISKQFFKMFTKINSSMSLSIGLGVKGKMKMSVGMIILMTCLLMVAPAAGDITFNVNNKDGYSSVVDQLRDAVKDPKLKYHDIPTVKLLKATDQKFIYINFNVEGAPAISMTIQIKKDNLYVIGYKDQFNGEDRAFYIPPDKGDTTYKESDVFDKVKQREAMKFKVDYASIQSAAQLEIPKLDFTLGTLKNFMLGVYGKATKIKDFKKFQARFFLLAVQMTAESARFEYVKQKTVQGQMSDPKVLSLEKNWDKISVAISCNPSGKFPSTVVLDGSAANKWEINTVADIKCYMGILKYIDLKKDCPKTLEDSSNLEIIINNLAFAYV